MNYARFQLLRQCADLRAWKYVYTLVNAVYAAESYAFIVIRVLSLRMTRVDVRLRSEKRALLDFLVRLRAGTCVDVCLRTSAQHDYSLAGDYTVIPCNLHDICGNNSNSADPIFVLKAF
jgi:hypothetical protein